MRVKVCRLHRISYDVPCNVGRWGHSITGRGYITYRAVERAIALVSSFLNVAFQRTRVERLKKLKAT